MKPPRFLLIVGTAALVVCAASAERGALGATAKQPRGVARQITTSCDDAIEMRAAPYSGARILFDRISVPPADHVLQSVYQRWSRPFRYVTKWGFEVRAGSGPVDVRVSPTWHSRLAISGASAVRFHGCPAPDPAAPWLGYANIYAVKEPACVSIIVTVAGSSERVRVPLGRPCPTPAAADLG